MTAKMAAAGVRRAHFNRRLVRRVSRLPRPARLPSLFETGLVARDTWFDSIYANIFTWAWLMVFLAWGRHSLSFTNRFIEWARDASYPVYILHQLFGIKQTPTPAGMHIGLSPTG